jgi:hypothetical protein
MDEKKFGMLAENISISSEQDEIRIMKTSKTETGNKNG